MPVDSGPWAAIEGTGFVERGCCPVCKSVQLATLFECDFESPPVSDYLRGFYGASPHFDAAQLAGARFVLEACRDCGLVFQRQIPGDRLMALLYDRWIDTEKDLQEWRQAGSLSRVSRLSSQIQAVIAFLGKAPNDLEILDFGLGWGRWASIAAGLGCRVCGTELSRERVEHAVRSGLRVVEMDKIADRSFDYIHTEQVFEHLPDPRGTLKRLVEVLAPGGLLKLSVPNGEDVKRRIEVADWTAAKGARNSLNLVSPLEHINCFDRDALLRLGRECGLEPVKIPLKLQFAFATNWRHLKESLRWNVAWPLYKNVLSKGTYLHFRRRQV